tara:strand:- start:215 stop:391 length:177 start_codon:yes stop_codon:yes gene_type:complete
LPKIISKKEPERPGMVIPETLIMPQKKTNNKLSFSGIIFEKLMAKPKESPTINAKIVL